ncbi:ras-related protein Rab-7L1-like isoform X2 [Watersipora subatra]|uniref:ras-related protein Rab-7L1-like isoform X2 n=1 Tax=Watersipora subatra TaxID=2589382 RepID=UPI00355B0912
MDYDTEDSGHKILIIGPPKAGKTTFITRYVHGHYFANEIYKETIGVDFALKHLDMEDGQHVTLQLWDIAGQERTQKMNRMYYQGAHACVIMFDLTYEKSLEISLKWKEDLDSKCTLENGEPIPCILLANKVDLASRRKFTTEEIEKFARENNFIHFMETSVKNDINVTESMQYLVKNLLEHENLPRARQRDDSDPIIRAESTSKPKQDTGCC